MQKDLKSVPKGSGLLEQRIRQYLDKQFGGNFRTRTPYRMMYENQFYIVYFQNFDLRGSPNYWYRLAEKPLRILIGSSKNAYVCLTNPADQMGYLIPIKDILDHVQRANWSRKDIEVNIDPAESRWRELKWKIKGYEFHFS
jgi:hypothetical protein